MVESSVNIHDDLKNILKEGYLEKESKFLKTWRRRWFVLTPNTIYSFKEAKQYKDPTEIIVLSQVITIKSTDDEINKENSFKIEIQDRRFNLCAASNHEKEQWIGQIGKAMVKIGQLKSGAYEDDQD